MLNEHVENIMEKDTRKGISLYIPGKVAINELLSVWYQNSSFKAFMLINITM